MLSTIKKCACLLAALGALMLVASPVGAQELEAIFERGNEAYAEGRWNDAADAYRELLTAQVVDARVHFNLANAEFRLGRLGPAILNYEKSRKLEPSDAEIQENLEYVGSYRFDRVEKRPPIFLLSFVESLQRSVGSGKQAIAALALFWLFSVVLVHALWRRGGFRASHGWLLAGVGVALLTVLFSCWFTMDRYENRELAVVMVPAADVVAGPGSSNPTLLTVHEGLTVEVLDIRPEWVQVNLPNGLKGWLSRSVLAAV
jgi:tetratricopeptide (TPR) repeat protein